MNELYHIFGGVLSAFGSRKEAWLWHQIGGVGFEPGVMGYRRIT